MCTYYTVQGMYLGICKRYAGSYCGHTYLNLCIVSKVGYPHGLRPNKLRYISYLGTYSGFLSEPKFLLPPPKAPTSSCTNHGLHSNKPDPANFFPDPAQSFSPGFVHTVNFYLDLNSYYLLPLPASVILHKPDLSKLDTHALQALSV